MTVVPRAIVLLGVAKSGWNHTGRQNISSSKRRKYRWALRHHHTRDEFGSAEIVFSDANRHSLQGCSGLADAVAAGGHR